MWTDLQFLVTPRLDSCMYGWMAMLWTQCTCCAGVGSYFVISFFLRYFILLVIIISFLSMMVIIEIPSTCTILEFVKSLIYYFGFTLSYKRWLIFFTRYSDIFIMWYSILTCGRVIVVLMADNSW